LIITTYKWNNSMYMPQAKREKCVAYPLENFLSTVLIINTMKSKKKILKISRTTSFLTVSNFIIRRFKKLHTTSSLYWEHIQWSNLELHEVSIGLKEFKFKRRTKSIDAAANKRRQTYGFCFFYWLWHKIQNINEKKD
jgi:hypothetical protein